VKKRLYTMAEGMEIFFKKINLLPSLNNLLENDTKKDTLKSLLTQPI